MRIDFRIASCVLMCGFVSTAFASAADSGSRQIDVDDFYSTAASQKIPLMAVGRLTDGMTAGQSFVCKHDALAKVEVLIASFGKQVPAGKVRFRLRQSGPDGRELASGFVSASSIQDNTFVGIEFPPISDSAGKTFYFEMEPTGITSGSAFTVWRSTTDVYTGGSLFVDGVAHPFDIRFRTYFVKTK